MADTQSARSIAYTRAPFSTWFGIVCLFGLFGLIVLAVIGPSPRTSDYEETRAKKRVEKLKTLPESRSIARWNSQLPTRRKKSPRQPVRLLRRQRKQRPPERRPRRPHLSRQ